MILQGTAQYTIVGSVAKILNKLGSAIVTMEVVTQGRR